MLEGEPLQDLLTQPGLGTSQAAEVVPSGAPLLDKFHLLI